MFCKRQQWGSLFFSLRLFTDFYMYSFRLYVLSSSPLKCFCSSFPFHQLICQENLFVSHHTSWEIGEITGQEGKLTDFGTFRGARTSLYSIISHTDPGTIQQMVSQQGPGGVISAETLPLSFPEEKPVVPIFLCYSWGKVHILFWKSEIIWKYTLGQITATAGNCCSPHKGNHKPAWALPVQITAR